MSAIEQPYYNKRAAMKLAIVAGLVAGAFTYTVNGQDLIRTGIAGILWLVIGWYGGKVIFARSAQQ